MIKLLLFDLSKTILFPKDRTYTGSLNGLNNSLKEKGQGQKFLEYFELDQELLSFLETLKGQYRLVLYTSETIQNEPAIHPQLTQVFEQIYSGLELNKPKDDPDSYTYICQQLSVSPADVLFIDDSEKNIEAARSAGLNTLVYTDFQHLRDHLLSR